jgi:octaprenyl-diphosphate synthase
MTTEKESQLRLGEAALHVAQGVEQAMRADMDDALRGCDPLLGEVLAYAIFGGGKRIRPLLTVLSSSICGRRDTTLYLLAAALEYLHVATLIHDDVIDHARTRRGRESVRNRYGMAVAILAGDWLHARSMHLIGQLTGPEGLSVFCRATGAMVDGEYLQLRHNADINMTEEQYFAIIGRKTASLIASTCMLGAMFAGASREQQQALGRYGEKVGIAFQVVDDLLDYLGDQETTGKKVGNDFIEGKITLPLISALARADDEEHVALRKLLSGDRTSSQSCRDLRDILERLGGFSYARQCAENIVGEAVAALDLFQKEGDVQSYRQLVGIAGYILSRKQ